LFTSTSRRPKVETLCSVCLDCDGFSAAEFNRFDYGRGWAPVLRIGEDYAWSIGGQTLRNPCTNARERPVMSAISLT
jgi:hypothetical protein